MKLGRNLYLIATAIVLCSLVVGFLTGWQSSGNGEGWPLLSQGQACPRAGGDSWYSALYVIAYFAEAVGVIWLIWYWLRLDRAITSMAKRLKEELTEENAHGAEKRPHVKRGAKYLAPPFKRDFDAVVTKPAIINELNEVIEKRIAAHSNHITELGKQNKNLQIQIQLSQRQKRNIEAIIYSLRDPVIVVDEFDRLLMANEAAGKLFNFDFKTSQYKSIDELIASGKSKFVDFLRQGRQSEVEATRHEIEFSQDDSRFRGDDTPVKTGVKVFDCIISCVYDGSQKVCGVVAVLHDMTREKQVQQMKNDFVSHVSHELKTPLASIAACSEMLADDEADDEETKKEFYSVIQNQAKRLNRLIEDILNISRIESGLVKVEKKSVSLTMLIEEQLQMIKSYAEEKNVEIIAQKPIIYDQVYADRDMISQVIINLLSNAVKYTPCGGTVKVETAVDENAGTAQVTVTDTGVGIPKDEIKHIFDKFYRVGANNKQAKGTGLGLNLVKQIIEEIHHGRVFVISEPGVGSTFGFELPLAVSQAVEAM